MKRHIIDSRRPMLEALAMLNDLSGSAMTLFATGDDGRLAGTLTDGDIRRALLAGADINSVTVADIMHRDFRALREAEPDTELFKRWRDCGIRLIPLLDPEGRLARIVDTAVTRNLLPVDAIVMAGGKGERLRPLTLTRPKPLLEVGGKAIIDYNIEAMARVGIRRIRCTVNYLAEQLEEHFSRPVAGVAVECVREPMAMGTIGSAALMTHRPGGVTLVMNSDLLTTIDLEEMYLRHRSENAMVTIAAIPYNVSVPYAILDTDGSSVRALAEKPSYSYYANAGIYMIDNSLLEKLPADRRTDATDLVESAIADGLKVTFFPVNGTWIDIGSPADYVHACELVDHLNSAR